MRGIPLRTTREKIIFIKVPEMVKSDFAHSRIGVVKVPHLEFQFSETLSSLQTNDYCFGVV